MTKSSTFTATTTGTAVETVSCQLFHIQITKAGSADTVITLYDNAAGTATGPVAWQGGGALTGDFDVTDGAGDGRQMATGLAIVISATTAPNVVVTYV